AHAAAGGRARRPGDRDEPGGDGAPAGRDRAGRGPRRQPPVRGAGRAGARRRGGPGLVRAPPRLLRSGAFADRAAAGRELAFRLEPYAGDPRLVVLALPRGGVPVGAEVARALDAPLDVFVVRKLGVPGRRELAMGAIASGGVRVLNREVLGWLPLPQKTIDQVAEREQQELERRELE